MACCVDCKYGEYKPEEEKHLGAKTVDIWCSYWGKWVGCSGKCDQYK